MRRAVNLAELMNGVLHLMRVALLVTLGAEQVTALQESAFYPAVDLASVDPGFQESPSVVGAVATPVPLGLDATQFMSTPDVSVRDVDGDGVLDLTHLFRGTTVWRGLGGGRFGPAAFVETSVFSTSPVFGRWGDMDGDGRLDGVFLGSQEVEVLLDQGDGTFVSTGLHVFPPFSDYAFNAWNLGLVDGDAIPDIVVRFGSGFPGTRLEVLYGLGGNQFSTPEVVEVAPGFINEVALGDLNGDGLTDIVVDHQLTGSNKLRTYVQQAGGGWLVGDNFPLTAYSALRLEVRDMTGDGDADVIVQEIPFPPGGSAPTVSIYVGHGDGTVSSAQHRIAGAGGGALFADVDGDGLVDVLSTSPGSPPGVSVVRVRADGSLAPAVMTPHRADAVGTADLDGDGALDLFSPRVVLFGRGDGGFVAPRSFELGATPTEQRHVAVADFNEDGRPDVAALDGKANGLAASISDVAATWNLIDLPPTQRGNAVAAGDLDLDGHADIILQQLTDSAQEYWLGRGDGSFTASATFGQSFMGILGNTGLGIGQINGTPWPDLVATGNGMLRRKLGLSELAFGALKATPLPPGGSDPWLVLRDLDGDGLDDVVVVQPAVYVYRCVGHGDFEPPVLVDGGATHVRIVDVGGDGLLDLIASDDEQLRIYAGDGLGGFAAAPTSVLTSDRDILGTAVADVDGDGRLDLVLGHGEGWSLHLALPGGGFATEPVDRFDVAGRAHALRITDADADGRPDVLVVGDDTDGFGLSLFTHRGGPWEDHGFALAGAAGPPFLWPTGTLEGGSTLGLALTGAAPGAPYHLIIGATGASLPFKGGVLVPDPLLIVSGLVIAASGDATLASPWPAGTPPGTALWLQAWVEDGTGPAGVTASNGVQGLVP